MIKTTGKKILSLVIFAHLVCSVQDNPKEFHLADSATGEKIIHTGIVLDTLENNVLLHMTADNKPDYYYSEIFTPVCQSGECLPIRINLFWTLAGNYLKYTLPASEILTKVDHLHFTPEDYHKLGLILVNKNATLRYLRKEDFVFVNTSDTTQQVDGSTGATKKVSRRDYVEGAIFTSLTLFHLVHGKAAEEMKIFTTEKVINSENLGYFLRHTDFETADLGFAWMKSNLNENEMLKTLLHLLNSPSSQVVDLAVRYIPAQAMMMDSVSIKINSLYLDPATSNETRSKLLNLWISNAPAPDVQLAIAKGLLLYKANFNEALAVLDAQPTWPEPVYYVLLDAMEAENNLSRREKIYRVFIKKSDAFVKPVRKKAKILSKQNGWS